MTAPKQGPLGPPEDRAQPPGRADSGPAGTPPAPVPSSDGRGTAQVVLTVNGRDHRLDLPVTTTLLDALRDHLHLTGSKKGCGLGQCGACTVLVEGRRVNACLVLAVTVQGRPVTTVEGLGQPGALHRCRQRSPSTTRCSAATARPARS